MDSTDSISADSSSSNRDESSDSTHDFSASPASSEATRPLERFSAEKQDSSAGNSSSARFERLGDYQIVAQIGRGGMGEVYLAREQGLARQVALKVLPAAARISRTQVKRFLLEAQAAAQLSHDHIVPIYHIGQHEGIHYFTMRYIEGSDLAQIIRSAQRAVRNESQGSPRAAPAETHAKATDSTVKSSSDSASSRIDLSAESFVGGLKSGTARSTYKLAISVALIGQAVAEALHHAHQHGIVHRDIKPSNLMLDHSHKIWVTDFGLAQLQNAPALTATGDILGTLRYMSPEQATGRRAFIDHRTDIYSLGVTLYELATLQRACSGDSAQEILRSITFERPLPIRKINPRLPRDLETIICKATERNPSDRYQTAEELAADLRRFANNESLEARRPGLLKKIRSWAGDRPGIAATIFVSLLVVAALLAVTATVTGSAWNQEKKSRVAVQKALATREAQNLLGMGSLLRDENPGLAIAAALDGAEIIPGVHADRVMMDIVDRNHELRTIALNFDYPGKCEVSGDGSKAVLCVHGKGYGRNKQAAALVDLTTSKIIGRLVSNAAITSAAFLEGTEWLLTNSASSETSGKSMQVEPILFGGIKLWNVKTLESKELPGSQAIRISNENFSRVHQQLVVPNNEYSATVFNLPGLSQAMVLPRVHEQPVVDCKFSPDGAMIVTLSTDGTAVLWNAKTGQKLYQLACESSGPAITRVYFTADSRQLALSGVAGTQFVSCESGKTLHKRPERLIKLSTKNDLAYFLGTYRTSILVTNTKTYDILDELKFDGFVMDAIPLADDHFVAAIRDEDIIIHDLHTGKQITQLKGHTSEIESLASVAGTNQLVSFGWDETLRHWDVYSDLERRTIRANINTAQPLIVRPNIDGTKALVGSIRELQTVKYNSTHLATGTGKLNGQAVLVLSGNQVVTFDDHELARWDVATQRKLAFTIPNQEPTTGFPIEKAIELTPGGTIALLTRDGRLYYWKPTTNALIQQLGQNQSIADMAFEASGQKLILGLSSGELLSLDISNGLQKSLTHLPGSLYQLDLHPDGNQLVVTCSGNRAIVWDLLRNETLAELKKPGLKISEARFVSGDRIVTHGSWEAKEISLWDWASGQVVDTQSLEKVHEFAVRPDRKAVAAAAESGAYYWDFESSSKTTVLENPCKMIAIENNKVLIATGSYVPNDSNERLNTKPAELVVWNSTSKALESSLALDAHVTKIFVLSNADFLASTYAFGIDYIDLKNHRSLARIAGHLQPVLAAAFQANPDEVMTVSEDGQILIHTLSTGKHTVFASHDYPIVHAKFSTDMQFLLTIDQIAGVRLWDLSAKKLAKEIPLGGKQVSRLLINSTDKHALVQLEKTTLKHLDLRTGTETDFDVAAGIRDAALSPDGKMVLVATGEENYIPGHAIYTDDRLAKMDLSPLLVFGIDPRRQTSVAVDGFPVGCQFIGDGQLFATVSSLGIAQVFEAKSLKEVSRLLSDRRIMQLLDAPEKSQWLYASAKHQICAWNPHTGAKVQELSLSLSEAQAALFVPHDLLTRTAGDSYLLGDRHGIKQRPIDAVGYAKRIAPQRLTVEAREKLLNAGDSMFRGF